MKILVTGATGFIGSRLIRTLTGDHTVFAPTRHDFPEQGADVRWIRADLSEDTGFVRSFPSGIDAVLYLAQSVHYREFPEQSHDIFNVNVRGLFGVLEYARNAGAKMVLLSSSANVYERCDGPITENSRVCPDTFYSRTKRIGELLLESYADYFHCIVLRLFSVYGPGQKGMLIPDLIDKVRSGSPITVRGKQGLRLSPVFVDDVCMVIRRFLSGDHSPSYDNFNVGGLEPLSILEIGESIGKVLGREPRFEYQGGEEQEGWVADVRKIGSICNLKKFHTFRDGLEKTAGREA